VQRGIKVLADRRRPQMSERDKETLFGATQYAKH
jgi:GST-like protein